MKLTFCLFTIGVILLGKVYSQETQPAKQDSSKNRIRIGIEGGLNYGVIYGSNYITPLGIRPNGQAQFDGFHIRPSIGLNGGVSIEKIIKRIYKINIGMFYFPRKKVLESDTASIRKYQPPGLFFSDNIKYVNTNNNLEFRLYLSVFDNDISCYAGVKYPILSYYNETEIKINGSKNVTHEFGFRKPSFIPSVMVKYRYIIGKRSISNFIAFDFPDKISCDLQIGIYIPLSNKN